MIIDLRWAVNGTMKCIRHAKTTCKAMRDCAVAKHHQSSNDDDTRIDRDKFSQSAILHPELHDVLFSTLLNGYAASGIGGFNSCWDWENVSSSWTVPPYCSRQILRSSGQVLRRKNWADIYYVWMTLADAKWGETRRNRIYFRSHLAKGVVLPHENKASLFADMFLCGWKQFANVVKQFKFRCDEKGFSPEHVFYQNGSGTGTLLSLKRKPQ